MRRKISKNQSKNLYLHPFKINNIMNLELTEEQETVRRAARDFARTELGPGVIDRDENQKFPTEQIKTVTKGDRRIFHLHVREEPIWEASVNIHKQIYSFYKPEIEQCHKISKRDPETETYR